MKLYLLKRILIAMSKTFFYGIILTCMFTGVLLANEDKVQHKSIKEVFISPELEIVTLTEAISLFWRASVTIFIQDHKSIQDQYPPKEKEQLPYNILSPLSFIIFLLSLVLYYAYRFYRAHLLKKISENPDIKDIHGWGIKIGKHPRKKTK